MRISKQIITNEQEGIFGRKIEIEFHEPVYITGSDLSEENENLRERVISRYNYGICN